MNKERLFMRKNSILIRLIKILFLFFCMSLNSVFADTWQIALIDKPKIISSMTQRSIALERNTNYPHMAYGGDHLYHTYYNGTAWQYETADMSNGVGEKASIAIDLNNKTYISYSDGGLKYATNASGSWVTTLVEGGSYGGNTSIAIDANNKSHISYFDFTNKLKYATNASGEWITIDVDISGNVADYASIAVDSNNKAHISYYYYTNGYLKYATNESGAWVISTVDTSGNLFYPSLAIDSNNKIHISYYNDDTSDLKYATNCKGM